VYPGSIELQSLSLGWTSGIDIRGLKVKDPEGRDLLLCDQFLLDKPLASLALSQKDFGSISIASPVIYCYAPHAASSSSPSKEGSHIAKESSAKKEKQPSSKKEVDHQSISPRELTTPDIKGHIGVTNANLIAMDGSHVVGNLSQGEISLDLDLLQSSKGSIQAELSQDSSKSSPLSMTFSINGAPQLFSMKGSFSVSCKKVPTEVLAALAQSIHPDIADFLKEAFGSSVSYSLSSSVNGPTITLHSTLLSDNLRSDVNLSIDKGVLTVEKGELLTGTVSPHLFQLLVNQNTPPTGKELSLHSPVSCSVENTTPLSINLLTYDLAAPANIRCFTKSPLTIARGSNALPVNISVNSAFSGVPEKPAASIDITASSAADTALFHLTASGIKKDGIYQLSSIANISGKWASIAETLSGFPVSSAAGQDLTGVVKVAGQFKNLNDFSMDGESQISSQTFQKSATFSCTQNLFSVSQASFDAKIPTSVIEKLSPTTHFSNPIVSVHVQSTINTLSVPLHNFSPVVSEVSLDANAHIEVPTVELPNAIGVSCSLESSDISIAKSAKSQNATFSIQALAPVASKAQPLIPSLIGPSGLHLKVAGKYDLSRSSLTVQSVDLSASRLSAALRDISCSFGDGVEVSLSSPATIRLNADSEMISKLPSSSPYTLAAPAEVTVTVKPFTLSQKDGIVHASKLMAEIQGNDIRLSGMQQSFGPYSLSIPVSFDMAHNTLTSEPSIISGTSQLLKGTATIALKDNSDLSLLDKITADCSVEVSQLPVALVDVFSRQSLVPLIGNDLSSKLTCKFNGLSSKGNRLTLMSSGAFWKANLDFALDAKHLSSGSSNAVDVEATLSPKTFDAIKSIAGVKSDIGFSDSVTVHIKMPQCNADLTPFMTSGAKQPSIWQMLDALSMSIESSLSSLQLRQKEASLGKIPAIEATCNLDGKNHALTFAVDSSANNSADAMKIAVKGAFNNVWNTDGLTLSSSHLRSTVDIDRFPTALLDLALPKQGALLEEAIGKTIRIVGNFSADEMKSGTVQFDLQAQNCTMHLDGIIQNGKMTLKTPAKASLTITKEAGSILLKNVNPLLATAVHSQQPIQLTVDPKGSEIPISPFSITGISLPKITADVGKIVVKNGGALKPILALLNMGSAANSDNLDVWLTPIYVSVKGGVVTCQRADALVANKIHMITWGDVDLGKDQLNMVVAIPQETLSELRLQIVTPTPERGLQIPITGSSANPKIDTKRATARLAGAAIVDNVPDKRLQIFGGLLQAAATSMGEPDKPIPPPTTQPFPWAR
jgi:hypothetical protein